MKARLDWGALALIIGWVGAASACERKAPSPDECLDLALAAMGLDDRRLLVVPEVKERIDAIVIKCLTTPYDKELIRCVKLRVAPTSCMLEFQARQRSHNQ